MANESATYERPRNLAIVSTQSFLYAKAVGAVNNNIFVIYVSLGDRRKLTLPRCSYNRAEALEFGFSKRLGSRRMQQDLLMVSVTMFAGRGRGPTFNGYWLCIGTLP
jgi:hypothetical protein